MAADDGSTFGVRIPRGLTKPITDFVAKFLHNMADNPVAVVLCAVLGLHVWGVVWGVMWFANEVMPAHVASIEAGYQRQSVQFIEAVAKMQATNNEAAAKAHADFAKEWEREREFLREIKEMLRDKTAFLPADEVTQ